MARKPDQIQQVLDLSTRIGLPLSMTKVVAVSTDTTGKFSENSMHEAASKCPDGKITIDDPIRSALYVDDRFDLGKTGSKVTPFDNFTNAIDVTMEESNVFEGQRSSGAKQCKDVSTQCDLPSSSSEMNVPTGLTVITGRLTVRKRVAIPSSPKVTAARLVQLAKESGGDDDATSYGPELTVPACKAVITGRLLLLPEVRKTVGKSSSTKPASAQK